MSSWDSEYMAVVKALDKEQHKYRKADHDRQRYAQYIRFLQERQKMLLYEYNALRAERDMLDKMLAACKKNLQYLRDKIGGCHEEEKG